MSMIVGAGQYRYRALEKWEQLPAGWIGLVYARLSWPLEALRHEPALMANQRRSSQRRQHVDERMAELRARRHALLQRARDAETELDLEETQAEMQAVEERP